MAGASRIVPLTVALVGALLVPVGISSANAATTADDPDVEHMGEYPAAAYTREAATLPADLLEALERDVEEAAASLGASRLTTFRRIILPALLPAITAGAALSFARAIGEYGSLVLLSGNLPNRTEVASVRILSYLENGSQASAASVPAILLAVALVVIVGLDVLQRRVARRGE